MHHYPKNVYSLFAQTSPKWHDVHINLYQLSKTCPPHQENHDLWHLPLLPVSPMLTILMSTRRRRRLATCCQGGWIVRRGRRTKVLRRPPVRSPTGPVSPSTPPPRLSRRRPGGERARTSTTLGSGAPPLWTSSPSPPPTQPAQGDQIDGRHRPTFNLLGDAICKQISNVKRGKLLLMDTVGNRILLLYWALNSRGMEAHGKKTQSPPTFRIESEFLTEKNRLLKRNNKY